MERTDQHTPKHDPGGYTPAEIAAATELRTDAQARINDIATRTQTATTPEEHTALGRESATAWGDYKSAGFVLTEGGAA